MLRFILLVLFIAILYAEENSTKNYRWFDDGNLNRNFKVFYKTVKKDNTLLCKERLDITKLESLMEELPSNPDKKEEIENLATKMLFKYIDIRNSGCYSPQRFFTKEEFLRPSAKDYKKIVTNPILDRLEFALNRYKKIKRSGGWQKITAKDTPYLYPGKVYEEIPAIKERLYMEGYYHGVLDENGTFTSDLKKSVIDFQLHHGLKPDGVIGPLTLEAMNVSVDDKIKKILINIERFRWFLDENDFFVFVDIPGFFLEVVDKNGSIFDSKVVVGRKSRPTPMMRHNISYAVLNPYWRAPKTIIKEDILPKLKKGNFERLKRQGIIASTDIYGKNRVNFEDIEWEYFDENSLPFYFLQKPGPHNFLGYLKLMFPNRFDVYLHDTNHRDLFKYTFRALSSGCIRMEKPLELFHLLINKNRKLTYRDIFDIIWRQKTKKIGFKKKIPVYLIYMTTYVDEKRECYFYRDIYGYDKRMMKKIRWRSDG